MTEYARFEEWANKNYPAENYFTAEDRLADIETRMNADGRAMPNSLRQSLLQDFQVDYDPVLRARAARYQEQLEIARFLGNGQIPTGWSEEIIASLQKPEIMGIDFSQFSTMREDIEPPKITRFEPIKETWLTGGSRYVKGGLEKVVGIKRKERSSKFEERPPIRDMGLIGKVKRFFRR